VQDEALTRECFAANNIQFRASEICPDAFVVEAGNISANSEAIRSNWIYLQDEASQLVAHLAANSSLITHHSLLDLCAAPGSKTSLMASLLPEESTIVACDIHLHRLQTMRELSARTKISNINLLQLDATKSLPFAAENLFDVVLLDAPCSGLGTLQRHPEIKWKIDEAKIFELAALQKTLLENAASQVSAGGVLVYSVCSTEVEESEEIIAEFCATHVEFRDVTRERFIKLGIEDSKFLTSTFGARTFTYKHGCESFFVCVLENIPAT
jgi:16S rRNA (cytosine967-C5)-methyltransferase